MFKRIICVIFIIIFVFHLSGCMSDTERAKAKELVKTYSKQFKEQAKNQYGDKAKVKKIKAETDASQDHLFYIISIYTTGNLTGTISVGKESFDALYIPDTNEIKSNKNHDKIAASVEEYFGSLGLNIIGSKSEFESYLSDSIISFEDLLENKIDKIDIKMDISIYLFVTDKLKEVTEDTFYFIKSKDNSQYVQIIIIEVDKESAVEELKNKNGGYDINTYDNGIDNNGPPRVIYNDEWIDALQHPNINSYILVRYSPDLTEEYRFRFEYVESLDDIE